jgi:hypothetical protein
VAAEMSWPQAEVVEADGSTRMNGRGRLLGGPADSAATGLSPYTHLHVEGRRRLVSLAAVLARRRAVLRWGLDIWAEICKRSHWARVDAHKRRRGNCLSTS